MTAWTVAILATVLGLHWPVTAKKNSRIISQHTEPFNTTLSNSEELLESREHRPVDPHSSWIKFVQLDGAKKSKKCRSNRKKPSLSGPPGPAGPPGPPGPPGAEVTTELLLREFKAMVREATERRAEVPGEVRTPPSLSDADVHPYRRVDEAFHCKLRGVVTVDKRTLRELQNFQAPLAKGAFLRGSGMDLATGRFTAPVTGIYQFSANIHIDHSEMKSKGPLRPRDNVRVLICIESLCQRNTSLEVIAGLESNSKIFTVYVHGLLQLQADQYTSIFVDNSAGASVSIQSGSDFMGLLVGV
ncbi:adipolin isoform X4 [Leucoraja erinacea]|uniref:adipolin isoform X4 n=1 Tax=Leucoraja erinaceus TaxID=7782 RepID=UPI002456C065|nr:adipolin isoform X4 [Leucoraja erinacea]